MKLNLHLASLSVLALLLALSAAPAAFAEDAMAPANAMGKITPMNDSDFATCQQEAGALTFPAVKMAALAACDGLHKGMDVMGAVQAMQNRDAMAPADAMAPVAQ